MPNPAPAALGWPGVEKRRYRSNKRLWSSARPGSRNSLDHAEQEDLISLDVNCDTVAVRTVCRGSSDGGFVDERDRAGSWNDCHSGTRNSERRVQLIYSLGLGRRDEAVETAPVDARGAQS